MIYAFDLIVKAEEDNSKDLKYWKEAMSKRGNKKIQEGLDLFAKHLRALRNYKLLKL